MRYSMFIDDLRDPSDDGVDVICRSSDEAIRYMEKMGCPAFISFDHDLGGEDTAMVVVNAMIERDLDWSGRWIPQDFRYYIHSANPVGRENILGKLRGYLRSR